MLEGGAETEVEPEPEEHTVDNTWFSKWVDCKRACSPYLETEFIVALFPNGTEERRGEVRDEKNGLRPFVLVHVQVLEF